MYSTDFEKALQKMVFFYVPFTLLYCLLTRLEWTRDLVRKSLLLLAGLAVVFACIGFVEYATKTIILNPKLVVANDLHTYFTVNSVFFDPDIFGRFLALVMICSRSLLLYDSDRREQLVATGVLAVLWGGLVLTLSRSSLAALLVGLGDARGAPVGGAPGAVRRRGRDRARRRAWSRSTPKTFGLNQGANGASSGRANLVTGGLHLFADRPLWGYGSGSFQKEYRAHHPNAGPLAASHTIPVTIAAEQGLIGEVSYVALVVVALVSLLRGARGDPVRAAIAAAFLALVFHTMLYADFLEDPVTWALLGAGMALARAAPQPEPARRRARAASTAPAAGVTRSNKRGGSDLTRARSAPLVSLAEGDAERRLRSIAATAGWTGRARDRWRSRC